MTHVETLAFHFVGYNFLKASTSEVTGALKLIGGLSKETGLTMQEQNLKTELAVNNVSLAHMRYAKVIASTTATLVDAVQVQASAWLRAEAAHTALTKALEKELKAYADIALIASRTYSDADRADLNAAANDRLAFALGERAIATRNAIEADRELAIEDRNVAIQANISAIQIERANLVVQAAYQKSAAVGAESAVSQIASVKSAGAAMMGVGAGFEVGAAVIAASMLYASSRAADFYSQIILLHTQARVATSQLGELNDGVLKMAGSVGFASSELAKGLFQIESVGGGTATTAHALRELQAAAMGAAVGHSGLEITARSLAAVMAVFPTMLPIQAMGQLDAIVGQGMMSMEDLNRALSTGILATLHSSGVSLADFGGALATMTDYAIPATQAANSLRMAIYLMSAPTGASNKVLEEFGLTTAEVSSVSQEWTNKLEKAGIRHAQLADDLRKPGGLILAMQDLKSHFETAGLSAEGQAEAIYKAFGGGKMGKAVITLYENIAGGAGASVAKLQELGFTTEEIATLHDRLITKTALINAQTNMLGKNFALIQSMDPAQMWKDFTASVGAAVIALGESFLPLFAAIIQSITPMVEGLTKWILGHKELTRNIFIGVAAILAIIGVAFILVGTVATIAAAFAGLAFIGPMLTPALILFIALAGAATLLSGLGIVFLKNWESVQKFWDDRLGPAASRIWNAIQNIWKMIVSGINTTKPIFDSAMTSFNASLNAHGGAWDDAKSAFARFSIEVVKWVKSEGVAALIATLAVGIPNALKLTLDMTLMWVDVLQTALTILASSAKVASDMVTGHYELAIHDATAGFEELNRLDHRFIDHMTQTQKDFAAQFDGTNNAMWHKVYDDTRAWQSKINIDGLTQAQTYAEKRQAQDIANGIKLKDAAYRTFYVVGQNFSDGTIAGIASKQASLDFATADAINKAAGFARRATRTASPSMMFAEQLGAPIIQGIVKGMEMEAPDMHQKFTTLLTAMANTPEVNVKPTFAASLAPVVSITHAQEEPKTLQEMLTELRKFNAKPTGPTTGVESLVYELTRKVDDQRRRGQKGYN